MFTSLTELSPAQVCRVTRVRRAITKGFIMTLSPLKTAPYRGIWLHGSTTEYWS